MIRSFRILPVVLAAASMLAPAAASGRSDNPITVTTRMDSVMLLQGSRMNMTVEVSMPGADAPAVSLVNAPEITDTIMNCGPYFNGTFVVGIATDSTETDGRLRVTNTYTLQPFEPGMMVFPPVGAVKAGSQDTAWAQLQTLKVLPVEVDTVEMALMPLAGAVPGTTKWHDYLPAWIFVVLGAIILAVVAFIVMSRIRTVKEQAMADALKPLPPYDLAIGRLNDLRKSGKASPGLEKPFYTELTDILRQYLQGRFGINAMEMTSGQIVRALRDNPETRLPADQVDAVLRIADFVKFAKEKPLADDNQRALNRATEFVETTKPVPVVEAPLSKSPADLSSRIKKTGSTKR